MLQTFCFAVFQKDKLKSTGKKLHIQSVQRVVAVVSTCVCAIACVPFMGQRSLHGAIHRT